MVWGLTPLKFNGVALDNADREVLFLAGQGVHHTPQFEALTVERIGRFPQFSRNQPSGMKVFPLAFVMVTETEAVRQALFDLFEPKDSTAFLEVQDGGGVQKRVACIAQGVRRERGYWVAPLLAPDPRLEAVTLKTRTISAMSGSSGNFSPDPDNVGDVNAPPVFKVTVNQPRWTRNGFRYVEEVTYANRSDLALQGPVTGTWPLLVSASASDNWDTAGIVKVASSPSPVTLAAAISSSAVPPFTISVNEAISGFDGQGMLVMRNGSGQEEQFEYDSKNDGAKTFNCSKRSLGGTTLRSFDISDQVWQSRMQYDGRDIAVFLDGVPLAPELVTVLLPNTLVTRVWADISDAAALVGTLARAVATGDTTILLNSVDHGFSVGHWLVLEGVANETVRITGIDAAQLTIQRGLRNTVATTASVGGKVYKAGRHIQIAYGDSGALLHEFNYKYSDVDHLRLPLMNLGSSGNAAWRFDVVPFWSDLDKVRPGGMMRRLLGTNRNQAKVTLYNGDATYQAWFEDIDPTSVKPNYDSLEFIPPVGVSQVSFDAEMAWPFLLELRAIEVNGAERVHARLHGHDVGQGSAYHRLPNAYADKTYAFSPTVRGVVLHARQCVVAGAKTDDVLESIEVPTGSIIGEGQSFDLTEDTELLGLVVRLTTDAVTSRLAQVGVFTFDGQNPLLGRETLTPAGWSIAAADMLTNFAHFCMFPTFATKAVLPAGSYFLRLRRDPTGPASGGSLFTARNAQPIYPRGSRWEGDGVAWVQQPQHDLWFAVLSPTADNEAGSPSGTGEMMKVGDVRVTFDSARTPIVKRQGQELARYLDNVWVRGSPAAQQFRLRWLVRAADVAQVTIDVAKKTVTEAQFGESIRFGISSVKDDEWLAVIPTADAPGFEDVIAVAAAAGGLVSRVGNVVDETHMIEWRDRWQV